MNCPNCKRDKLHRSHRIGWRDWALALSGRLPYRCHGCSERFYLRRDGENAPKGSRKEQEIIKTRRRIRWENAKNELMVYGTGVVVFLGVLYYLLQERAG